MHGMEALIQKEKLQVTDEGTCLVMNFKRLLGIFLAQICRAVDNYFVVA